MKLSPAQLKLLHDLANRPRYIAPFYAPFEKLVSLGLAEDTEGRFSTVAKLTDAGRALLAEMQQSS